MKRFAIALLIPLLLVMLASCDGDIQSTIADFMGKLSGNVWIDSGLVEPNTKDVQAVLNLVSATEPTTVTADDTISIGGQDVPVPLGVTSILPVQSEAEKQALVDTLSSALESPSQTEALVTQLSTKLDATEDSAKIEATKGSMKVAAAAVDQILVNNSTIDTSVKETLESLKQALEASSTDETELTQADVVMVQLMTNLVATTANAASSLSSGGTADLSDSKIQSVINESLFIADVAQQLSGVGNLDVADIIDIQGLISSLSKGAVARSSSDVKQVYQFSDGDALTYVNQIGPILAAYVQIKDEKIDKTSYDLMIRSLWNYRIGQENALTVAAKGGATASNASAVLKEASNTTALTKYLIAVVFTELDRFEKSPAFDELHLASGMTIRDVLESLLVNTPALITGTVAQDSWLQVGSTLFTDDTPQTSDALMAVFGKYAVGYSDDENDHFAETTIFKNSIVKAATTIVTMAGISNNALIPDDLVSSVDPWFVDLKTQIDSANNG